MRCPAFLIWLVMASELAAQSGGSPRAIPLPDTLGANFPISDTASAKGAPTDYDCLLGEWHFQFQMRREDGSWERAFPGHWVFEKTAPGGFMIADRWRADNPSEPVANGTYTYRCFRRNNRSGGCWEPIPITARGSWV